MSVPNRQAAVTAAQAWLAGLTLIVVAVYLAPFVSRGWIPHDEGYLGQTAERVMSGELPHIEFLEGYTGGLTFLHAAVFRVMGIDLLWLRWLLYAAVIAGSGLTLRLARRITGPVEASALTLTAVAWSFPNYFVAIPSWWNLVLALAALLALVPESGRTGARRTFVAGLCCGASIAVKITGVYSLAASVLAILYMDQAHARAGPARWWRVEVALRAAVSAIAIAAASATIGARMSATRLVVFVLPITAVATALVVDAAKREDVQPVSRTLRRIVTLGLGSAVPLGVLAAPYAARGELLLAVENWAAVTGRFAGSIYQEPLELGLFWLGVPVLLLAWGATRVSSHVARLFAWTVVAISPVAYGTLIGYQAVWQSVRLLSVASPVCAAWLIVRRKNEPVGPAVTTYAIAALSALWTLVQYPFSVGIYFCYTTVVTWLLVASVARMAGARKVAPSFIVVFYLLFAVVAMNRSRPEALGLAYQAIAWDAPLSIQRAHLNVTQEDARVYGRLVQLIREHDGRNALYATPDCPEVYFLSGRQNRTRDLFQTLTPGNTRRSGDVPRGADVVVLNWQPHFSTPPDEAYARAVRLEYELGERIGKFEVRWRSHAAARGGPKGSTSQSAPRRDAPGIHGPGAGADRTE